MLCPKCGAENAAGTKFCGSCGAALKNETAAANQPSPEKTATGLEKNVAGMLAYVVTWISGIIFLLIEKDKFVRFHAWQSIITFGAISIVQGILNFIILPIAWRLFGLITMLNTLLWLLTAGLWILLMIKAYQGAKYKLPIAGQYAEKFAEK
jgi:uncharacterized membrane protein